MRTDFPVPWTRRRLLGTTASLAVTGIVATSIVTNAMAADGPGTGFMAVSRIVTGRNDLNPEVGHRLMAALQASSPEVLQNLSELSAALGGELTPAQESQAVRIQQAWYLGTVGKSVVTYENALTFSAVVANLKPRSYCGGPPGFWASKPV
ncbi:MAG: sugar dehydrogenase complex small subunit [Rhodopila sp.]|nr:sugar dehydrogenase complex small subunit [Rhodopila sp.]